MSLKKQTYSVLVVSSKESFNAALSSFLSESIYMPVHTVSSISAAKRVLAERTFDFVFINSPLPDDFGLRFAIDICMSRETVAVLLVKREMHDEIYNKVAEHGVFTLPKPIPKDTLMQALCWMTSARERLRQYEKKSLSIEKKMEEIRLVNRAKWLLISNQNMSESASHRYIEKMAMDRCISKLAAAGEIIRRFDKLTE